MCEIASIKVFLQVGIATGIWFNLQGRCEKFNLISSYRLKCIGFDLVLLTTEVHCSSKTSLKGQSAFQKLKLSLLHLLSPLLSALKFKCRSKFGTLEGTVLNLNTHEYCHHKLFLIMYIAINAARKTITF